MKDLLTSKEIEELFGVTKHTLVKWRNVGLLEYIKINDRKFLYKKESIDKLLNDKSICQMIKKNVVYCRIFNEQQIDDLETQKKKLLDYMKENNLQPDLVIYEISSTLSCKREQFNCLLNLIMNNEIGSIFVTTKDKLTTFGFEYFEQLFKQNQTSIVVLNNDEESQNEEIFINELCNLIESSINKQKILNQLKGGNKNE